MALWSCRLDGDWGPLKREAQNYSRGFNGSLELEAGGEHMSLEQISEGGSCQLGDLRKGKGRARPDLVLL